MTENLFSYGTLQKEKIQLELFGRLLPGTKDSLRGFRLSSVEIKDEAFLSRGEQKYQLIAIPSNDKDDIIEGTVLEISAEELLQADKYEPDGYTRIEVILESGKSSWIYAPAKKGG